MDKFRQNAINIYKQMTVQERKDFYVKCLNNKFRQDILKKGLKALLDLIVFSKDKDENNDNPKIYKYIEKIFCNKNMLSQKYIKYSYVIRKYSF